MSCDPPLYFSEDLPTYFYPKIFPVSKKHDIIYTSVDGETWESQTSGIASAIYGVAYGKGLYVAVGYDGVVLTSPDAVEWTDRSAGSDDMNTIGYANNKFIAIGVDGLVRITDGTITESGLTWDDDHSVSTTSDFMDITYGNGTYVILTNNDEIYISPNGESWTNPYTFTGNNVSDITFGGSAFIAVGDAGQVWKSSNGSEWEDFDTSSVQSYYGVAYGHGRYVMVGSFGSYDYSFNGEEWVGQIIDTSITDAFSAIAYGEL